MTSIVMRILRGILDGLGTNSSHISAKSLFFLLLGFAPHSRFICFQNERLTAPADLHDTKGQFDPSVHSTSGIVSVSLAGFPQPIDDRVIKTTDELIKEFPFNLDYNSGKPLGLGMSRKSYIFFRVHIHS